MSERKQLTVWVSENQVDDWDSYQNELGFQNRSEMIRRAVEHFYSYKTQDTQQQEDSEQVLNEIDELKDKIDRTRAELSDIRKEQISQDNIQAFSQEISYHLAQDIDSNTNNYRKIIQKLADDGIKYIRIDMDAIGFPEKVEEEFGDMSEVVTIEDIEESSILRPLIANIAKEKDDIEDQYGIEILDDTEAVAKSI